MALIDTTDEYVEPTPVTVTVTLEHDAAELWKELMRRTGWDASELVGWALGAYWREMEGIVLPPPQTQEEADRLVAEGMADMEAGRTFTQEEVEAEMDALLADLTPEQARECYAGVAAIERGEGLPHEQAVAETKAKFGW